MPPESGAAQSGPIALDAAGLAPIEAPSLARLAGIRHGFFTRPGGVSRGLYAGLNCGLGSNDDAASVIENRNRVARHLGATVPGVVTLYQEHGRTALAVTGPVSRDALPRADAVVTATPGLAIGVLTADCGPILFADAEAGVIAAAHAGWRGAVAGILASTFTEMERLGARRDRIVAALGPCINASAYEVGPEFKAEFTARDPAYARFFSIPPGSSKAHFDLPAFILADLAKLGLASVESSAACTHADESKFFSFRRATQRQEPDYGRQISAIVVT